MQDIHHNLGAITLRMCTHEYAVEYTSSCMRSYLVHQNIIITLVLCMELE